jgi:hypothetical protein
LVIRPGKSAEATVLLPTCAETMSVTSASSVDCSIDAFDICMVLSSGATDRTGSAVCACVNISGRSPAILVGGQALSEPGARYVAALPVWTSQAFAALEKSQRPGQVHIPVSGLRRTDREQGQQALEDGRAAHLSGLRIERSEVLVTGYNSLSLISR